MRLVRPAQLDRPLPGRVDLADLLGRVEDHAARGKVRAMDKLEQPLQRELSIIKKRDQGRAYLFQVVRRNVGRHADGDPRNPVDQQVGELGRQDDRLLGGRGIVGPVIDGLLPQFAQERMSDRRQPALGIAHGRRRVAVDRPKIAVAVDQRLPQAERLRHPHQGVVDRLVAMRVVGLHHLADHCRALDVTAISRDVQVMPHRI